jgi:biopolymer transport protein ExbB
MKWLEILLSSAIVIWLLIACFVMVVIITIDKIKKTQSAKSNIASFSMKIRTMLKKKDIENALNLCLEDRSPIANIVRRGLKKHRFGRTRIIEEVEAAGQFEVKKLETGLSTLATISAAAPMLGFLGTILGMGSIFKVIQNTYGDATFGDFSHSIWNALISSGLGLLIGVIALAVYNYLVTIITKVVMAMERVASEIFDSLEDSEKENISHEEFKY